MVEFETEVVRVGRTATMLPVPLDVKEHFGRVRPPVVVRVNGYRYRSTPAVYGGAWLLPLRREVREAVGVHAGDRVKVVLEADTEPREVPVPPALARALHADPGAAAAFRGLSHQARRELAAWVAEAERGETRSRRVGEALLRLRRGR